MDKATISGKWKMEDSGDVRILLRNPTTNALESVVLAKDDPRTNSISQLPLETVVRLTGREVCVLAESRIADCTGKGDFLWGTIRDYIRDDDRALRHLILRDPLYISIQKSRQVFKRAIDDFFETRGSTWLATSLLTKATEACEDVTGLFWTRYENPTTGLHEEIALAQTSQLHLEALAHAFGNCYTIAPSFRNEKGNPTIKHLLEYWHVEAEFVDTNLEELMEIVSDLVAFAQERISLHASTERAYIAEVVGVDKQYYHRIRPPYPRITYDEALKKLQDNEFIDKNTGALIQWGADFDSHAERIISDKTPVFVIEWPDRLKAFYYPRFEREGRIYTRSFDLVGLHHGEIVGAGEREHRLEAFKPLLDRQAQAIKAHRHDPNDYYYYEDLRRIGALAHAGFGLGFERTLAFLLNLTDIRMASLFPRDQTRVYP
jgi:asparaginyl-tRNA synthetase